MRLFALCLTACLTTMSPALAHPGHGVTDDGTALHYLLEPAHIGPVLLLIGAGLTTALLLKRRKNSLRPHPARKR